MDRRDFLIRTGLSLGAAAFASSSQVWGAPEGTAPSPSSDWAAIRAEFDLDPAFLHLSGFLLASHPRPVREAIERHRRGLDANPAAYWHEQWARLEGAVLSAAAGYLGVNPGEIALTDSTTMGLGLLYSGLPLKPGQEILTSTHDHFSTHTALRFRAERTGATVRRVPLYAESARTSEDEIVGNVRKAISPATRYLALTWVHSLSGVKLPVRAIAEVVAEANRHRDEADRALLCIDGVHGLGVEDVTLPGLGCDFFVAGTHKWVFGPRGTGLVWGKPAAWTLATPTIPQFGADAPAGRLQTPGGFHSFEHRWALDEAFLMHGRIGKAAIARRIHALNDQIKEGLAAMPHVLLHTPPGSSLSAGIVCFDVKGMKPQVVVERLAAGKIVASVSPYANPCARLAGSLLVDPGQIDTALAAVRALA